jgi:hypothetical protein
MANAEPNDIKASAVKKLPKKKYSPPTFTKCGMLPEITDFHKIWQEQCEATRSNRERFGVKNALDYLVGEKLLTFARAADEHSEFAAELPRFQAAVCEIFNPYELRDYVASLKPAARKILQKLLHVSS